METTAPHPTHDALTGKQKFQKASLLAISITVITVIICLIVGPETIANLCKKHISVLSGIALVSLATAKIILLFMLFKLFFKHAHHLHTAEEILIGTLHLSIYQVVLKIGDYVNRVQFNSDAARSVGSKVLLGLFLISSVITPLLLTIIDFLAKYIIKSIPAEILIDYKFYNIIVLSLQVVSVIVCMVIPLYWIIALFVGKKGVKSGYIGVVCAGDKALYLKEAKSGTTQTTPGMPWLIDVIMIKINRLILGPPSIKTMDGKTLFLETKIGLKVRSEVKGNDGKTIQEHGAVLIVHAKETEEKIEESIQNIFWNAVLTICQKMQLEELKTGLEILNTPHGPVWEMVRKDMGNYGGMFEIETISITACNSYSAQKTISSETSENVLPGVLPTNNCHPFLEIDHLSNSIKTQTEVVVEKIIKGKLRITGRQTTTIWGVGYTEEKKVEEKKKVEVKPEAKKGSGKVKTNTKKP